MDEPSSPPYPSPRDLETLENLLDGARYQEAWQQARSLADIRGWRGAKERVVAGRLAVHLGAPRLGRLLHRLGLREHPDHPETLLAGLRESLDSAGPLRTWRAIEKAWPIFESADAKSRAQLLGQRATVAAMVRDFETAHHDLDQALALSSDPWIRVLEAGVLEQEDRLDRAAEVIDEALVERPWYRPAIQTKVHLLRGQGRDDDALSLLFQACHHVDHPYLYLQLAQLQIDLEHWADADEAVAGFVRRAPLLPLDRSTRRGLDMIGALTAYHQGQLERSATLYASVGDPKLDLLAARLRDPEAPDGRRVLDVPWVRQHHDTCSPATLTAICRYWGHGVEHLELAEEICYGGTPAHSERRWARENQLVAHELTVDWPTAVALLDRGMPFTLVTSDAANAHLQAVVGYDLRRRSFLCRDPSIRQLVEIDADQVLDVLRSTGPRGMVLLPPDKVGRLDGITLAETELYDLYDVVEGALADHRRADAVTALESLRQRAAGHRLELFAQRAIAAYDGDIPRQLSAIDALLQLYPDDPRLQLARLACLGELGRRQERIDELRRRVDNPSTDPLFALMLASELAEDARADREVERLLEHGLRRRPLYGPAYGTYARWLWGRRQDQEASRLFRWAACLVEVDEGHQINYFVSCRQLGRLDQALDYLRRRAERLGGRSGQPAITLATALEALDQNEEALALIEESLARRPDDQQLLLDLAARRARRGQLDAAKEILASLEGRCPPSAWFGMRATLAEIEGDLDAALADLRTLLAAEPTSIELHARIAQLTAALEGQAAALDFLRRARERFPFLRPLAELQVQWAWREGPTAVHEVLGQLLALDPDNAWALRELAGVALQLRRLDEAAEALDQAAALEPASPSLYNIRGQWFEERGELEQALACYRRAIESQTDNAWAIGRLPAACPTPKEQRAALRWIAGQVAQSVQGAGLLVFHQQARRFLPPAEVLDLLTDLHERRPELWTTWSVRAEQLAHMGRLDEGIALAAQAIERFPFQTELRRSAATLQLLAGRPTEAQQSLERLLEIDPADSAARVQLARLHLDQGRSERCEREGEEAHARNPLDPEILQLLAEVQWRDGRREIALRTLERAVETDPAAVEAWDLLQQMGSAAGQAHRALRLAHRLLERRRDDVLTWSILARLTDQPDEALRAIERAIALAPRATFLHRQKVELLANLGDLPAALLACRPEIFGHRRPAELLGEEAQVLLHQGAPDQAIATLERAVKDDPGYFDGWARLTEWGVENERWELAGRAAEHWTLLAPNDPVGWCYRAETRYQQDDEDGAATDFSHALELDSGYPFAGLRLAEIEEKRGGETAALAILEDVADKTRSGRVFARAIELGAKTAHPRLGRWIHAFALAPDADGGLALAVVEALLDGKPESLPLLDEAAFHPDTKAPLATARVDRLAEKEGFDIAWELLERWANGHHGWGQAAAHLLQLEADQGKPKAVAKRIDAHRRALGRSTPSWGQVGYRLAHLGQWAKVVEWLSDYRERSEVAPWMLVNLSIAHRILGHDAEAFLVSRHVIEHERPGQGQAAYHRLWVALWLALEEGDDSALHDLAPITDDDGDGEAEQELYRLAKALAEVVGRRGDGEAFRRAKEWIRGGDVPVKVGPPYERRLYDRVAYRIAREIGGFWPWLWAFSHQRTLRF